MRVLIKNGRLIDPASNHDALGDLATDVDGEAREGQQDREQQRDDD